MVGVARRSWARNENAMTTVAEYNKMYEGQDLSLIHISISSDSFSASSLNSLL